MLYDIVYSKRKNAKRGKGREKKMVPSEVIENTIKTLIAETRLRKTSPTAVAERLESLGYKTMTGRIWNRRPIADIFDFICEVAQSSFDYRIHGNVRYIREGGKGR